MPFGFNSKEDIARIAEAVKAYERSYRNEAPQRGQRHPRSKSSSGLTVEDDDSNPSYGDITKLQFDQSDGFILSNPAAGTAKVDLDLTAGPQGGALIAWEAISLNPTTTDNWVTIYTANGSAMAIILFGINDTATTTANLQIKCNDMFGVTGDYQGFVVNTGSPNSYVLLSTIGIGQAFIANAPYTRIEVQIKNAVGGNPAQSLRIRGMVIGK